jgi:putative FmdB family regulatory protein
MPTYEYLCDACGHRFEQFQSITAAALRKCPACGKAKLRRLIGLGAAVLFKGGGFYETDYRSESYRKAEEADRGAVEKPATTAEAKADAKPAAAAGGTAEKPSGGGAALPASAAPAPATPAPATPAPAAPTRSGKSHAREGRGVGNLRGNAGGSSKPAKQSKPPKPLPRRGGGGRRGG